MSQCLVETASSKVGVQAAHACHPRLTFPSFLPSFPQQQDDTRASDHLIHDYKVAEQDLKSVNIIVVFINQSTIPDNFRYHHEQRVPYFLLSDENREVGQLYGIVLVSTRKDAVYTASSLEAWLLRLFTYTPTYRDLISPETLY